MDRSNSLPVGRSEGSGQQTCQDHGYRHLWIDLVTLTGIRDQSAKKESQENLPTSDQFVGDSISLGKRCFGVEIP